MLGRYITDLRDMVLPGLKAIHDSLHCRREKWWADAVVISRSSANLNRIL